MRLLRTTFPGPAAATRVHGQFATSLNDADQFAERMELESSSIPMGRIGSESGPPNLATETNAPSCPPSARNPPSPVPIRLCPSSLVRTRLWGSIPDPQGKYREVARSRAVTAALGAERSRILVFLGLISLQAETGNGIATSREVYGRSRARKPAEVGPEKWKATRAASKV
jgi:hypothetical protein